MGLEEFNTRLQPLKSKLYRFALKYVRDKYEAEDIVQEVLTKVWLHRDRLGQILNFDAWCMKLVRNQSLDRLKSQHHKITRARISIDTKSENKTPYQQAELNDSVRTVRLLIESLPEKQREVIHLRDVEGFSYKEISDIMEMDINLVKVSLFRARTTIKTKLLNAEAYGTGQN
jgi:RNA polymerase sigma factor (sigma-70 family)